MKTILILFITLNAFAQKVIYVTDLSDKKLIAYHDSLNDYFRNQKFQSFVKYRLLECKTNEEWQWVIDSVHKVAPSITRNDITYLYAFTKKFGLNSRDLYVALIPKPAVKVVYKKPTRYLTTTYINIDINGATKTNSIKKIINN